MHTWWSVSGHVSLHKCVFYAMKLIFVTVMSSGVTPLCTPERAHNYRTGPQNRDFYYFVIPFNQCEDFPDMIYLKKIEYGAKVLWGSMGYCQEEDERHQTQQCRWPKGRYQSNLGFHYTRAVPQVDCLHVTPHWCSNSCKRRPNQVLSA